MLNKLEKIYIYVEDVVMENEKDWCVCSKQENFIVKLDYMFIDISPKIKEVYQYFDIKRKCMSW